MTGLPSFAEFRKTWRPPATVATLATTPQGRTVAKNTVATVAKVATLPVVNSAGRDDGPLALRARWLVQFGHLHPPEHRARLAANWVRATLRNQGAFAGPEGHPEACLACGANNRANEPLLPFLRPGGGHDWLHGVCVAAVAERRTEAVEAAMREAGIEPPASDAARSSLITPGGLPWESRPPAMASRLDECGGCNVLSNV
jgi:hypothetical protein